MAYRHVRGIVFGAKSLMCRGNRVRLLCHHSTGEECDEEQEEEVFSSEWYEKAYSKTRKWRDSLKEYDLVGGRLVSVDGYSRVFDDKLEEKMRAFKSIVRLFIRLPSVQETMRRNLVASLGDKRGGKVQLFSKRNEREELTVSSLTKVADILSISAQERKVVRHNICPQVTQYLMWNGALDEVLNGLKSEIDVLISCRPNKEIKLAHQIVVGCMKFLKYAISYDPESTSWMRLNPAKGKTPPASPKWEDVLEMFADLVNCLCDEKELAIHTTKLEVMKEGLYQLRDVLIDKNIGYKETRYQEHLVQKRLTKTLGHSSKCLFTLLLYYLYGTVRDIDIEVRGGVHSVYGGKSCLYMGKILTSDEDKVVWDCVKQLDRALGLFKFVWEVSGKKDGLELQGHLWCVGADSRSFSYRENMYFLHGISL